MPTEVINGKWVRFRAAAYLGGRGLSFGCSHDPIVPQFACDDGKYALNIDTARNQNVDIVGRDLSGLASKAYDHVFIGTDLAVVPLRDLISKLKLGGHLILYGINTSIDALRTAIEPFASWQEKDTYQREKMSLGIWKLAGWSKGKILPPKPKAAKRACIARYGAIGDMIMLSPVIRLLHEQGYEVTLNITPYCAEVVKHNPHVANIVVQERDIIPNHDLGEYWNEWMKEYDKYINLSESIEGKILRVEGRRDFYTIKAWRETDVNYIDHTLKLSGLTETGLKGEIYFSNSEEKDAQRWRNSCKDKFFIMWALKGSSHHKIYPLLAPTLGSWLDAHPDASAMLVGSEADRGLQFQHPQVHCLAGVAGLRQVFCLTKYVNVVVGPESAIINAAGCFDTPKITLLSHSNHNNLCKYFTNDYCLQAEVQCSPCHQLHYSAESCPLVDMKEDATGEVKWSGPICAASGIHPTRIWANLDKIYNDWKTAAKA